MIQLASRSVLLNLERRYTERFSSLSDSNISLGLDIPESENEIAQVSFFLYRVDVDRSARHRRVASSKGESSSRRWALSLELHYLLSVSCNSPEIQQEQLSRVMSILEENSILYGEQLARPMGWQPGGAVPDPWSANSALIVSLESMTHEDMLRLWDAIEPSYRLSVPYLVRTVQLSPKEMEADTLVDSVAIAYVER